ncbi:MAG: BTB/POZ domain-containing protein [Chlamydiales bacterium]|nr:BTB/POZ domain-containing protein [Chlamydiia bacterium]MCP5506683.1 BTB/POZ domain-containing protein [Chlamydiales bacterium]
MFCLKNLLNKDASRALHEFARSCVSEEDLFKKIKEEPSWVISIFENMNLEREESAPLAAKMLYHISLDDLENPMVKNVETVIRNKGLLNRGADTDFLLKKGDELPLLAHRSILALESPYFRVMKGFKESQEGTLKVEEAFTPEVIKHVVDYLYFSDERRNEFITTVDKALLPSIAALADLWEVEELRAACDEDLCNSLAEISLEKSDIDDWLLPPAKAPKKGTEEGSKDSNASESSQNSQSSSDSPIEEEPQPQIAAFLPKFAMLLKFIKKEAGEGEIESVIEEMLTKDGAVRLAAKCTPEEIKAFATLKTEFGKVCRIPEGTFGLAEWEHTFPVIIKPKWVPPLPKNIHAILEQEDPTEPGKKLKETCAFFLRPEKVILREEDGSEKKSYLTFEVVNKLTGMPKNRSQWVLYSIPSSLWDHLRAMPATEAGWVLIRKEMIPGSRFKSFENQKRLLKEKFEVPTIMDAALLYVITHANEGKRLYRSENYTRCQEKFEHHQTMVGGSNYSELIVDYNETYTPIAPGLSGVWKF